MIFNLCTLYLHFSFSRHAIAINATVRRCDGATDEGGKKIVEVERTITKMNLENLNPPCKASSISKASQSLTALTCKVN